MSDLNRVAASASRLTTSPEQVFPFRDSSETEFRYASSDDADIFPSEKTRMTGEATGVRHVQTSQFIYVLSQVCDKESLQFLSTSLIFLRSDDAQPDF
jgi:hypothetical protein